MALIRLLKRFFAHSFLTQCLLLPTFLLTGVARLLVLCVPFKILSTALGQHRGIAAVIPLLDSKQQARVLSIGRAVRMSSTLAPWNANCQAQAIAARCLFGLFALPYSIFYGVAKSPEQKLKAHAWLASGNIRVTGGYAFDEFTVLAVFTSLKQ